MTLPPITGRGPPRLREVPGRKAAGPDFAVTEAPDTAAPDAPLATVAVTPLLALQAEGGKQPTPGRSLAQVAGGALWNLDRLQLSLLRADPIPGDLLAALAEAADHLVQAGGTSAVEWRPLVMRIKVELARHDPAGRLPRGG